MFKQEAQGSHPSSEQNLHNFDQTSFILLNTKYLDNILDL